MSPPPPHDQAPTPAEIRDIHGMKVRLYGQAGAPAVLLLHGLLLDGAMWDGIVRPLSANFRVIVPDFLNHGDSGPAPKGYTLLAQADDVARLLDSLELADAVLIGFSMGGMTAMQLAAARPSRVRALGLVNTSAGAERAKARARYSALAWSARVFGIQPWLQRRASAVMFGQTFRRDHPEVVSWWEGRLSRLTGMAAFRAVHLVMGRPPVHKLSAIRVPTLVIASDEDTATPADYGRHIAESIAGASFQHIPRCGHCSPVEQPALVAELLSRFCERVCGVV